jgi:hypothetical protein
MSRLRIGEMLVQQGRIDSIQLQSALAHQARWGGPLGRSVVHLGFVDERAMLETVAQQVGVPFVEIGSRQIPPRVLALVPERVIRERKVLPLELLDARRGPVVVAFSDPSDLRIVDEVAFAAGSAIAPVLAGEADLERAIARTLDGIEHHGGFASRADAIELPEEKSPSPRGRTLPQ